VSGNDVLEYLRDDPDTDVILMYLESFGNPFRFSALAKEITRKKPIIAVKAGRTAAGARAASSHTGAMASTDVSVDALFEECGVIRTNTIEEMFDLAMAFAAQPLPRSNRIAIVSNAGGPAILATDMAEAEGLKLADFSADTVKAVREVASTEASLANPIDLVAGATPEVYATSLRAVLSDPGVDGALAIFAPTIITPSEGFARAITAASAGQPGKTVTACVVGLKGLRKGFKELQEHSIPLYRFPESAVRTMARMMRFRQWRERPEGSVRPFALDRARIEAALAPFRAERRAVLLPDAASKEVLAACGFRFPEEALANDAEEALAAARKIGWPVVLKAILEGVSHKTDIGGVMLDVETEEELRAKHAAMMENLAARGLTDRFKGVLVQKFLTGGVEVILGVKRDDSFGHLLMFGLGGIAVEVLRDVVFRIAPVTDRTAAEMVRALRGFPLLQGFRGSPGAHLPTIEECIQRLSRLVEACREIDELDVNPMIVGREAGDATALDVRIALRPLREGGPAPAGAACRP
jgi:acyl-CoA synthetase (NDP forming)